MFSSHLTAGLHLVVARRGMCYSSLLTSTSLEVVCLEEEKSKHRGARQYTSLLMIIE